MSGIERIVTITVAVKNQDEALRWFTEKLGFVKRMDMAGPGMRWLTVAPAKQTEVDVVLASWFPEHVGKNPPCVLETPDCRQTHEELKNRGVKFTQAPTDRPYGIEAVFEDFYGNSYALVQRSRSPATQPKA
jgi:predicted enzyme related to lactoylglutathione lyase